MNCDTTLWRRHGLRWLPFCASSFLLTGCRGVQSALAPAGEAAIRIAHLFWWMTAGAAVVWLGVMILSVYVTRAQHDTNRQRQAKLIIIVGAVAPTVTLAILLVYGLALLPEIVAPAPKGALRIHVHGKQWWWRVRYEPPGAQAFELANEVRLPVGEPVEFLLYSDNVIHSFWIPSLGGKMDLIPGRVTRLVLHPTKTGAFRGVCAEYCGAAHAQMAFYAFVIAPDEFYSWLAQQSDPTRSARGPRVALGQKVLLANGIAANLGKMR